MEPNSWLVHVFDAIRYLLKQFYFTGTVFCLFIDLFFDFFFCWEYWRIQIDISRTLRHYHCLKGQKIAQWPPCSPTSGHLHDLWVRFYVQRKPKKVIYLLVCGHHVFFVSLIVWVWVWAWAWAFPYIGSCVPTIWAAFPAHSPS